MSGGLGGWRVEEGGREGGRVGEGGRRERVELDGCDFS